MLKERQKNILHAAIREYIRTAKPVSSQELAEGFGLGVSSATVRNEMQHLGEQGYLAQPHTSAGRIPTDQGYRFFVDNLLTRIILSAREERMIQETFRVQREEEFVRELAKTLAHLSGLFSAAGIIADELFYECGFSEILEEPEFGTREAVSAFGRFADHFDEEIEKLLHDDNSLPQNDDEIFIGEENPLPDAQGYAMMMSQWHHPAGFDGFIVLVGPKRMNYSKQKALLKRVRNN